MNTSLISLIIPVYNVEKYIEECLYSVICQTYTEGFECILVDDCGIDKSVEKIGKFISNYRGSINFIFLHHEKNKGLSAARNTGIRAAKGKYLLFIDSDDKLYPNSVELLLDEVQKHNNVDIVQGSAYSEGTNIYMLKEKRYPSFTNDVNWIRQSFSNTRIPDTAWNKLVNREFLTKNNLYFTEGLIQEDSLWAFYLQRSVKSIAFCFEPTYYYRYNPTSIMNANSKIKLADSFINICNVMLDEMQRTGSSKYDFICLRVNALRIYRYAGLNYLNRLSVYHNYSFKFDVIKHIIISKFRGILVSARKKLS